MPIFERFANNAFTTLNGGISSGAVSLVVTSAASFPAVGRFRILIDSEIYIVTAVSGTTFTVTPGSEGTSQAAHSNGAEVRLILTKGVMDLVRPVLIVKAGDESVLNNTLQDDDDLFFAVAANEKWKIAINLTVTNAAATGDIKLTFTFPAAATFTWNGFGQILAVAGDSDIRVGARFRDTSGASAINWGVRTGGTPVNIRIEGVLLVGANAGTFQLQWAQDVTDGANATIVKGDSFLEAQMVF